jgi:hypothetical protein
MIHSLIQYALLSLGLAASLALFLSMKREFHLATAKSRKRLEEITHRLDTAHSRESEVVYLASAPPRPGLNVSKRVQAVRMLRRHEDVAHISAALGVTRKEVELLIHVHRITRAAATTAGRVE